MINHQRKNVITIWARIGKDGQEWARLRNTGVPEAKFALSGIERPLTAPWTLGPAYLETKKSFLGPNLGIVEPNPSPLEPKFPMTHVVVSLRAHACHDGWMTRLRDDLPLSALYKTIQP